MTTPVTMTPYAAPPVQTPPPGGNAAQTGQAAQAGQAGPTGQVGQTQKTAQNQQSQNSQQTGDSGSDVTTGAKNKPLLDPQAFLQLLVAQLQYQDPTKPVDTSAFLNQTATLTQVQSMTSMTDTLTSMLGAQQAQSATAMIGKQVTYTDAEGQLAHGVVTAAALHSGGATVQIGDVSVPLSSITEISAASTDAKAAATEAADADAAAPATPPSTPPSTPITTAAAPSTPPASTQPTPSPTAPTTKE
jgi:flagellar basal-body rod modification protein FlgD